MQSAAVFSDVAHANIYNLRVHCGILQPLIKMQFRKFIDIIENRI